MRATAACMLATQLLLFAAAEPSWTYRDFGHWPTVNEACGLHGTQSPIDIPAIDNAGEGNLQHLVVRFSDEFEETCGGETVLFENGHTVEWEFSGFAANPASELCTTTNAGYPHVFWDGKAYNLKQIHLHAPSEHTVGGRFFDMEAHHVHEAADGTSLVVALFLEVDDIATNANGYLAQILPHIPDKVEEEGGEVKASEVPGWDARLPYRDFWPRDRYYWHYNGSFTTPNCTIDTPWIVLQQPVQLSEQQLSEFRTSVTAIPASLNQLNVDPSLYFPGVNENWNSMLGVNNRPTQYLGTRQVYAWGGAASVMV